MKQHTYNNFVMKLKSILLTITVLVTFGQYSVFAQTIEPKANASLDTTLILIGDHVTMQIDVDLLDSTFIQFPVYTDTIKKVLRFSVICLLIP